jgi:hypothetical protein
MYLQATSSRRQSGFLMPSPYAPSSAAANPSRLEQSLLSRAGRVTEGRGSRCVAIRSLFSLCDDSRAGSTSASSIVNRPIAAGTIFFCAGVMLRNLAFCKHCSHTVCQVKVSRVVSQPYTHGGQGGDEGCP